MNTKYILTIFGTFFIISTLLMFLMISGNWTYFIMNLKWILRITTPIIIIYLFYLGNKS